MNTMQHFEQVIQSLFDEYVPGRTYKIVEDMPDIFGVTYPVLKLDVNHISAFSTDDAEYQFKAVVWHFATRSNGYPPFVFRQIVDRVLTTADYSGQLSMSFGILWALLVGIPSYEKATKNVVLNQKQFVELYIDGMGDMELVMNEFHRSNYGQDCTEGGSVPAGLRIAA